MESNRKTGENDRRQFVPSAAIFYVSNEMARVMAIARKGGVRKTTLTGLMIQLLEVNEYFQISVDNIYVIGDIINTGGRTNGTFWM